MFHGRNRFASLNLVSGLNKDAFVDGTVQIVCHLSVQIVKSHILHNIINVSLHDLLLSQRVFLLELSGSRLNRVKLRVWLLFIRKEWKTAFIRRFAIHLLHVLDSVVNLLFCFGNIIRMQTHQIIVQSLDSSDKPRCLSLIQLHTFKLLSCRRVVLSQTLQKS